MVDCLRLVLFCFLALPLGADPPPFYRGADLSSVNQVEDFGGSYRDGTSQRDPFALFSARGANLVRVRLWVDPRWTPYGNLRDVIKTLKRAKNSGMAGLLALHYSDTWADPGNQSIPEGWKTLLEEELVQKVHDYTVAVLETLDDAGVLPSLVQIGNETNPGLLKQGAVVNQWERDARLFNAGLLAVREVSSRRGKSLQSVLHVAEPENASWWFRQAELHGVVDFDVLGLSYYPQWSSASIEQCGQTVERLASQFGKPVLIVETAVPWTLERNAESASNVLDRAAKGYTISPQGQRDFLVDLTLALARHGGAGLVYWEPAWIPSRAVTPWGQGSPWENSSFFDFRNHNQALPAFDFLSVPLP